MIVPFTVLKYLRHLKSHYILNYEKFNNIAKNGRYITLFNVGFKYKERENKYLFRFLIGFKQLKKI